LRYLPRHEWVGTWLHTGLLVASVAAAIIFYGSAARTLRGTKPQSFRWKTAWRDRRAYQGAGIILVGIVLSTLSFGAINGVRTTNEDTFPLEFDDRFVSTDVRTWVPWAFGRFGYSPFADLRETDVSTKPDDYWRLDEKDRNAAVRGASLRGADLRYVDAVRVFLTNADLRGANLQKANLYGASLREANCDGVNLRGANLWRANLREADLDDANLSGAYLQEANLQKADLLAAQLQGADLRAANLQKANLQYANLKGAHLAGTNVTASQIKQAHNWQLAFYSDSFLKELGLPRDHNETVKKRLAEMEKEKEKTATKP